MTDFLKNGIYFQISALFSINLNETSGIMLPTMLVKFSRTKKKTIEVRVKNNCIEVVANRYLPNAKLKKLLLENSAWIASQRQAIVVETANADYCKPVQCAKSAVEVGEPPSAVGIAEMFCGKAFMLCGQIYRVAPTKESKTYADGNCVYVNEKHFDNKAERLKCLRSYTKKMSEIYLSGEISKYGTSISLCPMKIEYKELKNSWLNCESAASRRIVIDFRAVQLPPILQRYLIVHSFAHFVQVGHGDAFWNVVSNYLPRYKELLEKLATYEYLKEI